MKHYMRSGLFLLLVSSFSLSTLFPAFPQKQSTVAVLDFKGHDDFVNLVREEVEAQLKTRGFRIVVATSSHNRDLSHLERELETQGSKYAQKGENHPEIGHFRGADLAILGTVEHSVQTKAYTTTDVFARVTGLNTNYKILTVEVKLEIVDLKTREQLAHGRGSQSVKYSDDTNSIASRTSYSKARREATIQASQDAVRQLLYRFPIQKSIK